MDRIDRVMQAVPRTNFLPLSQRPRAGIDVPLPIGFGQTNSQPSTVRQMLRWLDPQPGDKILDVGSGSGWTTALLSALIGLDGIVYAVEKVPQLIRFGRRNCRRSGVRNARFFKARKAYGLAVFAPYDRILVSAASALLPEILVDQLRIGGRMVIPVGTSIHVIDKLGDMEFKDREYPGFLFVPLVG